MRDDKRPWDWMLDGVAPFMGVIIGLTVVLSVMDCLGG